MSSCYLGMFSRVISPKGAKNPSPNRHMLMLTFALRENMPLPCIALWVDVLHLQQQNGTLIQLHLKILTIYLYEDNDINCWGLPLTLQRVKYKLCVLKQDKRVINQLLDSILEWKRSLKRSPTFYLGLN